MKQIGRLAMRKEGDDWNAYYAMTDTMDGAIFLGSIRMGIIVGYPKRKNDFLRLMREIAADLIEEKVGARPQWDEPQKAPEHERGG